MASIKRDMRWLKVSRREMRDAWCLWRVRRFAEVNAPNKSAPELR